MTKKHFKRLAEIIANLRDDNERAYLIDSIGELCSQVNPNFSWLKWAEACKVSEDKADA